MATAANRQQFPNLGAAMVTPEGLLTQEWRQFFSTLWARTGSAIGGLEIKTGTMLPFAGSEVPEGYLLCDGSAVLRTSYPNLYAVLGSAGSSSTTFNLPDARGRSLIGKSSSLPLGSSGGVNEVLLEVENIPVHTHELIDPGHVHGATAGLHNHAITDPGHVHAVVDPGHIHGVTDPGHTHAVTDPGHVHTSLVANALGTAGADPNSVAGNTGSATTGLSVNPSPTGVTVNSGVTGLSVASGPTGVTLGDASGTTTIDEALTGITLDTTGSGVGFSVLNPYLVVNWIIKT